MKILHVIASLAPQDGGPPKACVEMASALTRRGHYVEIFTMLQDSSARIDARTDAPVEKAGVFIRFFPAQIKRVWPLSTSLLRALKERVVEFDLVHIHSLYLFHGIIAGHYCRKHSIPYWVTPHGSLDPYLFRRHRLRKAVFECLFEYRNIRQARALHYTSNEEKLLAESEISGLAPGVVVSLGLNLEDYANLPSEGEFRAAYPEIGDRLIVLFLGRLNFTKGLDILVPAFSHVAHAGCDAHLVIAGPWDDGYGKRVQGWVEKSGLSNRVTFTGMLQGVRKLAALRDADVFVMPSYTESFGIAVTEAMACGLPVVISNKVNIWREVAQAGAGIVTDCDERQCGQALLSILEDLTSAQSMGERGRYLVETRFNWRVVGENLEDAYKKSILGSGSPTVS